jgi:hypothetical protein
VSPAAALYRPTDGRDAPQPRPGYTERKLWHANRYGGWVVYVVAWPTEGVVKAGMTCASRWVGFQATGGHVLMLWPHYTKRACLDAEDWILERLALIALPAFTNPDEAAHLLGQHGEGFSECFTLDIGPAMTALSEGAPA